MVRKETCGNCGTTYSHSDDDGVRSRKVQYEDGTVYKEYVCFDCVDPKFLSNSNIMKKLHLSRPGVSYHNEEWFLWDEKVDKKWLD